MNDSSSQAGPLVFGDFLEYLRRQGFSFGVGDYLRLQELLNKVSGDCAPADLKTLLCPILATNKTQQEQFYAAFDSYFDLFQTTSTKAGSSSEVQKDLPFITDKRRPKGTRKRLYVVAGVLALGLGLALVFFVWHRGVPPTAAPVPQAAVENPTPPISDPSTGGKGPNGGGNSQDKNKDQDVNTAPLPDNPQKKFYQRYRNAIYLSAIFAPLLCFLLYEWHRFNRRKLILEKQSRRKPPFFWPLNVEAPTPRLYDPTQLYTAARLMRQRQMGDYRRLDIDATVAATIAARGYTSFRYKRDSKPPEYLVLIDRRSLRDHQAQLFDELASALAREGLFIKRYFYEGDPRVCQNEMDGSVDLIELQNKYAERRLLFLGDGEKLVNPLSGKLESWAAIFAAWHQRALFTPEAPSRWGLREISLNEMFSLLPATLEGLSAGVDSFELLVRTGWHAWQQDRLDAPPADLESPGVVDRLRDYLGKELFQWLCACAVYPELQWNLTLYLGSLACMPEGLVREANVLKLIRLPWFRSGLMPDELRWLLIGELDHEKDQAIRASIIEFMEKSLPPQETFAADAYQLNLVIQRWLFHRQRKRHREMLQVLRALPQSQVVRDYTVVRFLESARRSSLDFLLPRRLHRLVYPHGIPAFGLRTRVRFLAALMLSLCMLLVCFPPHFPLFEKESSLPFDQMQLEKMIARFAPTEVAADSAGLSPGDRQALDKIIQAARLMDDIFLRQVWSGNVDLKAKLEADKSPLGQARLHYFMINQGPWSRLDQNKPFIPGVPLEKPKEAGFYPDGLSKDEFNAWAQTLSEADRKQAEGFFTVIRRDAGGKFKSVPYSQEYQQFLAPAARLLQEAAGLTTNATLKDFLTKRAAAFLSDNYYASDVAWMDLDAPIDVTIGPYETYEDELFGSKAAYEGFVTLRDDAESAKLVKFSSYLQELENNLPMGVRYRTPKLGAASPIRVVDVVFASGDGNRGVQTAAFNLPNDEQVIKEKGSKRVMLKNMQEAKFNKVLIPISKATLDPAQSSQISFDAFFTHILMHELLHGLGPHNLTVNGNATTVPQQLKELYSAIEEAKADITGLWALQYLIDKGAIDRAMERDLYTTYLASSFRSVRFGITEAHGKGQALQLNYLSDEGGIKYNATAGTYSIDPAKIKDAVRKLTNEILTLQAEGSYEKAKAMLDKYGVIRPETQKTLDSLRNIPVDIEPRFTVAERVP